MRSAIVLALFGLVACSGPAPSNDVADATTALPADAAPASSWDVPAGWRSELIPFPLAFAPDLAHHGVEEARFPPGVFDVFSTNYWAYAFAWRIDDPGPPDATALSGELTAYYRGLLVAVDTNHLITMPDAIVAHAEPAGDDRFALTAHLFDSFNQAQPVDVTGTARRATCGAGSLWVFAVAPPGNALIRDELDTLTAAAQCGQAPQ